MLWVPSSSGSGPHAITGTPRPPAAPKAASSHRHTSSTQTHAYAFASRYRSNAYAIFQKFSNTEQPGSESDFGGRASLALSGSSNHALWHRNVSKAPSVHRPSTSISIRTVHYFGTINTRRQGMLLYVVRTGVTAEPRI